MSMISKICNLSNLKTLLSLATSNISQKLTFAEANIERYYSKRYTYCDNCNFNRKCNKPKNKPRKTPNRCPAPGGRCVPFENVERKKSTKKPKKDKNPCNKRKCTPGMKNKCDGSEFPPTCTLTSAHRQWSCNECPREEPMVGPCPTGNWDKDSP